MQWFMARIRLRPIHYGKWDCAQQSITSEGDEHDTDAQQEAVNIQLKTLQESPLQCIQNNYAQRLLVLMKS